MSSHTVSSTFIIDHNHVAPSAILIRANLRRLPCSIPESENFHEELFEAECHIAISVVIVFLEYIRHTFETDAGLHKQVKTHSLTLNRTSVIKRVVEDPNKGLRKPVAKRSHRLGEFNQRDATTSVLIKFFEQCPPGGEKLPEVFKLFKGNCRTLGLVRRRRREHAHERSYGSRVERSEICVY
jgi:hypothetical protein